MKTILDTGPLVALMNTRDRWHAWAVETFRALEAPLMTCEAVLVEAAHLTGAPAALIAQVSSGALQIALDLEAEAVPLERLLRKYRGRMDLADACVVRLSELHRRSAVLTLDVTDFSFYRRNGREVIPLVVPE